MNGWDPEVVALAKSVRPDIPRIRAVLDQLGIRNADYEDPADYVPSAFVNAAGRGKVLAFQAALVKADLIVAGEQTASIEHDLLGHLARLQTFTSSVYTPSNPLVSARRMMLACELVCRIDVDGKQAGTGVLVAPTLVATAAHVVCELVDATNSTTPVRLPGSTSRIQVTFGDVFDLPDDTDEPTRLCGSPAPLADQWLALYSPPAAGELGNAFVIDSLDGIGPDGPWDVAILRLAESRATFRAPSARPPLPRKPFLIHVLHHPNDGAGKGLPIQWSIGRVDRRLGDPPVRLLHSANTSHGSSGAPVYDAEFRVIGLHQAGGFVTVARDDQANNRAVPALCWQSRLAALELPDVVPYVRTVDALAGDGRRRTVAVIGRRTTQQRIWKGTSPEATPQDRLLAVLGAPGLGLRFTKYLVHALVTPLGGAYASLDVVNCQGDDATTFAAKVTGAFAASAPPVTQAGLTTRQRDTRDWTAPALTQTLERIAGDAGAWLVLEGFDSLSGQGSATVADLARQLILDLPSAPHVRLVLAGWQEPVPPGYESSIEYLEPPSADDLARTLLPVGMSDAAVAQLRPHATAGLERARALLPYAGWYQRAEHARMLASEEALKAFVQGGVGT